LSVGLTIWPVTVSRSLPLPSALRSTRSFSIRSGDPALAPIMTKLPPKRGMPNQAIAAVAASISAAAARATIVHIFAGLRRGRNGGSWTKAS
jgi:hypothetical protein